MKKSEYTVKELLEEHEELKKAREDMRGFTLIGDTRAAWNLVEDDLNSLEFEMAKRNIFFEPYAE